METFIAEAARFGAGIFIAVVVFIAYKELVGKLTDVVKDNTAVMTQVRDTLAASCAALSAHEERTVASRHEVAKIAETTTRIETKVDRLIDNCPHTGEKK